MPRCGGPDPGLRRGGDYRGFMTTPHRIIEVKLDSNVVAKSADIEVERHRAISDLLDDNNFCLAEPEHAEGPYRLFLSLSAERMTMQIGCTKTGHEAEIPLPLSGLKKHIN